MPKNHRLPNQVTLRHLKEKALSAPGASSLINFRAAVDLQIKRHPRSHQPLAHWSPGTRGRRETFAAPLETALLIGLGERRGV